MDEEVELAPFLLQPGEDGVDAGHIRHVAMAGDKRADLGGQRLDALLQRVALVGQRDLGALLRNGLGDAPRDRTIVGHAKDQAFLAGHQALTNRHMGFSVSKSCEMPIAQAPDAFKRIEAALSLSLCAATIPAPGRRLRAA